MVSWKHPFTTGLHTGAALEAKTGQGKTLHFSVPSQASQPQHQVLSAQEAEGGSWR